MKDKENQQNHPCVNLENGIVHQIRNGYHGLRFTEKGSIKRKTGEILE